VNRRSWFSEWITVGWVWMFFVEHHNPAPPWSTIGNNFCDPDPCGVGCARLATLAIAPPLPQGLGWSFRRANYRKIRKPARKTSFRKMPLPVKANVTACYKGLVAGITRGCCSKNRYSFACVETGRPSEVPAVDPFGSGIVRRRFLGSDVRADAPGLGRRSLVQSGDRANACRAEASIQAGQTGRPFTDCAQNLMRQPRFSSSLS